MSWVCSRVSATPIAAKPAGSHGPKCQARASVGAASTAAASSPAQARTTVSACVGLASGETRRSYGR